MRYHKISGSLEDFYNEIQKKKYLKNNRCANESGREN